MNSCILIPTRDEALRFPRGDLKLGFCESCGFIENVIFDPGTLEYSGRYEETQIFSPKFREYIETLTGRLVETYDLRGKRILEIGCGKGEFLAQLCVMGGNRGVGVDPACVEGRLEEDAAAHLRFINDLYSEKYAHVEADFVCCRHTLEHIQNTRDFVRTLRSNLGSDSHLPVFFEVPDVGRILREGAFWDIYYEHCSYFSPGSLAALFRSCGFDIQNLYKAYDAQYLLIEATVGECESRVYGSEADLEILSRDVQKFSHVCRQKLEKWRADLEEMQQRHSRAVLWGASSKAVAYLTTLGVQQEIEYVVDINPHKHGMYLPGTAQKVMSPGFLKDFQPDLVIAMNSIYVDEIRRDLFEMGIDARLIAV